MNRFLHSTLDRMYKGLIALFERSTRSYICLMIMAGIILLFFSSCFTSDSIMHNILLHLAGPVLSLVLIIWIYKMGGEEPVIQKVNEMIILMKNSEQLGVKMAGIGIDQFYIKRADIDYTVLNDELLKSQEEIFILARDFHAISRKNARELILNFLLIGNKNIRLLVGKDSQYITEVCSFINEQSATMPEIKNQFIVRSIDVVPFGITGTSDIIYYTLHFSHRTGHESPVFRFKNHDEKYALYNIVKEEFDKLWKENKNNHLC